METERKILKDCPISCFADEISTSLDRQIAVLHDLGISHIELRSTDNVNVADYSMDYAKEVRRKLADAGIRVSAIGSGTAQSWRNRKCSGMHRRRIVS